MTGANSPRRMWWLLVGFASCYFALGAFYPRLLIFVGVNHFGVWFLDSYAILASNDAIGIGRDPYLYNPLDPFGRAHVYSHWWLHLRDLGLTRADNFRVGAGFILAFFIAAIGRLRPRDPREVLWYLAILCSSPVVLALNRANNDLVIFALLAPVVPGLLSPHRWVRMLPVLLIALAAGLKFYPAIAGLILFAGANPREVRQRLLAGGVALALVAVDLWHDVALRNGGAPKAEGLMTFGAPNLLAALGLTGWPAILVGMALAAAATLVLLRTKPFAEWKIAADEQADWLSFALGATLLVGCFFTGRNFAYRWVFALWLAPLLWRLPRDSRTPAALRRLAMGTAVLLGVTLWVDPVASCLLGFFRNRIASESLLRWADRVFLFEQPVTWALFVCLLGFVVHFARTGLRTLLARE